MDVVQKALGLVESIETDSPNGAFEVVLSAATLDRDGEIIDSRAFEPLPDHIPFDIDHDMTVKGTIGSGTPFYAEDGSLRVKGTFASTPLAQEVRTLVSEGHIRTTSVTFMSAERMPADKSVDHVPHVTKAELLNGTFTPIPSNREAVVLSAKSLAAVTEKAGARNSAADQERIQSMHDDSVALGAACPGTAKSGFLQAMEKAMPVHIAENKEPIRYIKAGGVDDDPKALAQAVDASLDEAINLLADVDTSTLPEPVAQAIGLLTAADAAMDELMIVMGAPDPDEDAADDTAGAAADAAAPAVRSAAVPPEVLARLSITENAARLAFGR